jgi:hypothetical protein
MSKVLLFAASLLLVAGIAMAGIINPCNSPVVYTGATPECYFACPKGDTNNFVTEGFWFDFTINDIAGLPIEGIPFSDFWVVDCDGVRNLTYCPQPAVANNNTDVNGQTRMSLTTLAVGGCANGLTPVCQGYLLQQLVPPCTNYCFQIQVRSADMTGDLVVNIADLGLFATYFPPNPYNECGDFDCGGAVNIGDLARFAFHFGPPGHTC